MWIKRLFDILVSAAMLLLLLPILGVIAVTIKIDSPGPVFFRQARVGLGGKIFVILKFRSMISDAEKLGGYSTKKGDLRITRTGQFFRRTSLDELPQLLNVLIGDMSLVGPRPDVPAQKGFYTEEEWTLRHKVRPGITGLAQATVRSDAKPGERKSLDLQYVRNSSLIFDLKIILLTVKQLVGRGSF